MYLYKDLRFYFSLGLQSTLPKSDYQEFFVNNQQLHFDALTMCMAYMTYGFMFLDGNHHETHGSYAQCALRYLPLKMEIGNR